MARVVDKRRVKAEMVEAPADDGVEAQVAADVVVRRMGNDRWPDPFGLLAGQLPDVSIDDIKRARRVALVGEDRV